MVISTGNFYKSDVSLYLARRLLQRPQPTPRFPAIVQRRLRVLCTRQRSPRCRPPAHAPRRPDARRRTYSAAPAPPASALVPAAARARARRCTAPPTRRLRARAPRSTRRTCGAPVPPSRGPRSRTARGTSRASRCLAPICRSKHVRRRSGARGTRTSDTRTPRGTAASGTAARCACACLSCASPIRIPAGRAPPRLSRRQCKTQSPRTRHPLLSRLPFRNSLNLNFKCIFNQMPDVEIIYTDFK